MKKKKKATPFQIGILGFVLGILVMTAISMLMSYYKLSIHPVSCASYSMGDELRCGCVVVGQRVTSLSMIAPGDIIVYTSPSFFYDTLSVEYISHRLVSINGDTFIAKGDNNTYSDLPAPISSLRYKLLYKICFW